MTISYRFLLRRGLAAALTAANEVPLEGEMVIETDTRKFKFGDGTTAWNGLPYAGPTVPTNVSAFTNDAGYLTSVNNGNWSGADLGVTNGGTGASSAGAARTNLGLAIGTDVQAHSSVLAFLATASAATAAAVKTLLALVKSDVGLSRVARNQANTRYYPPAGFLFSATATGQTSQVNFLYAHPFDTEMVIGTVAMEVVAAGAAGAKARLGIYATGSDGRPSTLLVDIGEIAADSTGVKTLTLASPLTVKEPVWLCYVANEATFTLRVCDADVGEQLRQFGSTALNAISGAIAGYRAAFTYGVLPSTYPGSPVTFSTARAYGVTGV